MQVVLGALELEDGGRAVVRADCNRGTGSWRVADKTLKLDQIALTLMMCQPGSQGTEYVGYLQATSAYTLHGDTLAIELANQAGTMMLAP